MIASQPAANVMYVTTMTVRMPRTGACSPIVERVHDRTGTEEHIGLEEAVVDQVEDREHVADRARARRPAPCTRSGTWWSPRAPS